MRCIVTFSVSCPVIERGDEDAIMCITGSCEELGVWDPMKVVRMVQDEAQDSNRRIWKANVNLPCDKEIKYRYAVCSFLKLDNGSTEDKIVVHTWETNITPRTVITQGVQLCQEEHSFGDYDGQQNTDTGWLTSQTEMQLLIHGQPLTLQGCDEAPPFNIKITARQERALTPDEESTTKKRKKVYDTLPVFIRVLNSDEYEPCLHEQAYGRNFQKGDIMIFSVQTLKPDTMSFKVEIFSQDSGDSVENLGVATILGRNVRNVHRCVPLIDQEMDNIGTLEVTCTIIKPLQQQNLCNFESSYSKYWRPRRCVEIGHRGMGRSLVDKSLLVHMPTNTNIPENTVKSLQQALKHGADFVEFDIHVTKDRVPVIGHDFQAALTPSDVLGTCSHANTPLYLEVPINYLNLSEIDSLKTGQCMVLEHTDKKPSPCSSPTRAPPIPKEMQLFPTLQFALEEVDSDLGFLIEVKYPMDIVEGSKEMPHEKHPLERNALTDAIINIIMKYGAKRRIILCAFDPVVCVMLRLKQNKYPVLYANFGPSERYQLYAGPLCTGIPIAKLFANSMGFLGLSSHSIDLLRNPDLVAACHDANLVTFCWGEDNNDEEIVSKLKELKIHGVLHDSMAKYPENRNNIFREERLSKSPQISRKGVVQTNGDVEEGIQPSANTIISQQKK